MQKVLAYLTLYQDKKATELCLKGIKEQSFTVHKIFIIDNSTELLISKSNNFIIKDYPENIGVSAGIKEAIKFAIKENYDFIWTFDQDSIATPQCLETLLSAYEKFTFS